jgi:nitrite reductase (NADH) small subunit
VAQPEESHLQHRVGDADELQREGCRVIEAEGRRIAILSVGDRFYALRDRCPHKGASLCRGTIGGTFLASAPGEYIYGRDDQVIRCPWHGWEFDLESGRSLLEPDRVGVRVFPVTVEDGVVVVHT